MFGACLDLVPRQPGRIIARWGDRRRMLAQAYAAHVALDGFGVLDRAAEHHVGAAFGTGAGVDLEDPHQELRPLMVLDLLLVDGLGVEALSGLRVEHDPVAPTAMRAKHPSIEDLVR